MSEYIFRTNKSIKCCGECPAIKSPAGFTGNTYFDGCHLDENLEVMAEERHENCPLVELPEHGRLIDADRLTQVMKNAILISNNGDLKDNLLKLVCECTIDYLKESPTVLEASK